MGQGTDSEFYLVFTVIPFQTEDPQHKAKVTVPELTPLKEKQMPSYSRRDLRMSVGPGG